MFVHTCLVLDHVVIPDEANEDAAHDLLLAALLHDVSKPETFFRDETGRIRFNGHDVIGADRAQVLLEELQSPRRSIERVRSLVASHMRFPSLPRMRKAKLRRFLGDKDLALHLRLHAADCGASHGDLSLLRFCEETLAAYAAEPVLPEPLLGGRTSSSWAFVPADASARPSAGCASCSSTARSWTRRTRYAACVRSSLRTSTRTEWAIDVSLRSRAVAGR